MSQENYRYYCLDHTGHLHSADAIAQIVAKHPDSKCEIWQGKRLVAAVSPEQRSA